MDIPPGTVVERYTVEAELGRGGLAVVYRVRHRDLGTAHALKVLMVPVGSVRERLLREGKVQASLNHPNIVNVTDVLEVQGSPALVMQFVSGSSLDRLLERRRLSFAQVDSLVRGIVGGVAYAHRRGMVHRDLKPGNILLQVTDDGLTPKVADFGLVKVLGNAGDMAKTRSGAVMGTPMYMSPEQVKDSSRVDARADVFALGAILYEMVCGTKAFRGENIFDVFSDIVTGVKIPPRDLVPDLPETYEAAILGALAVDADDRIPDCETLLAVWSGQRDWRGRGTNTGATRSPWDDSVFRDVSDEHARTEASTAEGDSHHSLSPADAPAQPTPSTWSSDLDASAESLAVQGVSLPNFDEPDDEGRDELLRMADSLADKGDTIAPPLDEPPDSLLTLPEQAKATGTGGRWLVPGLGGALMAVLVGVPTAWWVLSPSATTPSLDATSIAEPLGSNPGEEGPVPAPAVVVVTPAVDEPPTVQPDPVPLVVAPRIRPAPVPVVASRAEPTPEPAVEPQPEPVPEPLAAVAVVPSPQPTPGPVLEVQDEYRSRVSVRHSDGTYVRPGRVLAEGAYDILLDNKKAGTLVVSAGQSSVRVTCVADGVCK